MGDRDGRMNNKPIKEHDITTQFGHDGNRVLLIFSEKIKDLAMTPEQARVYVGNIQSSLDNLLRYQAEQKAKPANG